ncbi:FAD-dependent urate hydroxylase [Saccharopolyspora antimicrobica]|uniref:FAD-dependent urate hydroxylase n=1 Tax=Saccharopolyspora antimicrobica TaxID=455193 RepID=A0A1I4Q9T8_9PSEU|nr:FAD-dependent monooxygenase [Saccharopolyspora antimicrobica]RKT84837.1 FAD-dependent urate hydroxylase [Saccharopolyspora antimicrobica]SFM36817.1 FAD-dependent urate hydroxylase [Saccharopolyspora antimicrobica]
MRVLVIGAGVGGLAIANGLLGQGHEVQVFEHADTLRTSGAGITVWSNGTAALRELGIDIEPSGRKLHSLRSLTDSGRLLWEADLGEVTERLGSPTVQIARRELIAEMAAALPPEVLHFGRRCVGVVERPDSVAVEFDDGSKAVGDLLIGADGQRSVVRRELLGGDPAKPTGWASWQGLTRSDLPVAHGHQTLNIAGRNAHCGLIPTGGGLLHWWFDMPWKEGDPVLSVADLRAVFAGWPDPVEQLLASVTDDDLGFFPHIRHKVPHVWGGPRSTLLGDAVHAMPPAVAQAANQTLEDAWLLTQYLSGAGDDLAPRLRAYEQERRPRALKVSRTAALTSAQRSTPLQRLAKFPGWLATRSQVASLRSGSNVLRGFAPRPAIQAA